MGSAWAALAALVIAQGMCVLIPLKLEELISWSAAECIPCGFKILTCRQGSMAGNLQELVVRWLVCVISAIIKQLSLLSALLQQIKSGAAKDSVFTRQDWEVVSVSGEKQEFLSLYGEEYGYPGATTSIDQLRASEFRRLQGTVYLDHAGATLFADKQLQAVLQDLSANLYGNPHSQNDSSMRTAELMESARSQVLKFFNASLTEYKCIFTSGATSALKLVGESFPWNGNSQYMYTMENHNSVLGLREYALEKGATVTAVDVEPSTLWMGSFVPRKPQRRSVPCQGDVAGEVYNLFAFPGECNFSGAKFDLGLVQHVKEGNHVKDVRGKWLVLVDAAKSSGTCPPDLARFPADFVTISFYKIFGYPTGVGALLVRNDAAQLLQKKYFGGGTVAVSIADTDFMKRRERIEQWFEDGTPPYLAIAALRHGFSVINQLTLPAIQRHTGALTKLTVSKLKSFRHYNGREVCTLYGNHIPEDGHAVQYWGQHCEQGPVIAFNLKRSDGSWVGYREVERLAALKDIHLRGGCFCNPGACAKYVGLSHSELQENFEAGHVCWDDHDVINGNPTGAVRVSFGYMSSYEDAMALVNFISKFFVDTATVDVSLRNPKGDEADWATGEKIQNSGRITLESITVYPIKSCGGFTVDRWYLSNTGLLHDREFCIVTARGNTLTQKVNPALCLIQTWIDLSVGKLFIQAPNKPKGVEISLQRSAEDDDMNSKQSEEVGEWLSDLLGVPCTLVRMKANSRWTRSRNQKICTLPTQSASAPLEQRSEMSFANEGQFLLVSRASVYDLNKRLASSEQGLQVDATRFRPNFVVSGGAPYSEDNWKSLRIGDEYFLVFGSCTRCQIINIDPGTGHRDHPFEPLRTLATYRSFMGKVNFGILLVRDDLNQQAPGSRMLKVGDEVHPE